MITVAMEEVVREWCDMCGREVTNSSSCGNWDKTFCFQTMHEILGKRVYCEDAYKVKLQLKSADIGF